MVSEKDPPKASENRAIPKGFQVETAQSEDVAGLELVEESSWAPWLRFPKHAFASMIRVYPEGQFLVREQGDIVAHLETTRIQLRGIPPENFPSWDQVAGSSVSEVDLMKMFDPKGDAICLLSMSVDPGRREYNLSGMLMNEVEAAAKANGAERIVGPFRPSNYGQWRREQRQTGLSTDFERYLMAKDRKDRMYDKWLGIVTKLGFNLFKIDPSAMKVEVSLPVFQSYLTDYLPEAWDRIGTNEYDCTTEAGLWEVKGDNAYYTETNYWGEKKIGRSD